MHDIMFDIHVVKVLRGSRMVGNVLGGSYINVRPNDFNIVLAMLFVTN